ncbi:MAG TPA: hypothetical protein VHT91_44070 [Kofleriaceae bacterium]|nr:hypothetical protein [Kofleriaceae bacterium]
MILGHPDALPETPLELRNWRVNACGVTPDGRQAVSGLLNGTVEVWDLATGHQVAVLRGHHASVNACAVTPDGRQVVSASGDKTLKVWNLATAPSAITRRSHDRGVNACAVTPDGCQAVSASADGTLKVWDLESGACVLTHHASSAYLAVATTATSIVAGDAAGSLWFLDWPVSRERSARSLGAPGWLGEHAASSHQTRETRMTRDELLTRLSRLLPSQFEEVLFRTKVSTAHLPSASTPQATRAIEAIRYLEQQNQLEQLAQVLEQQVAPGPA